MIDVLFTARIKAICAVISRVLAKNSYSFNYLHMQLNSVRQSEPRFNVSQSLIVHI